MKEEYMETKDILIQLNETLINTNHILHGVVLQLVRMNRGKM